MKFLILPLLFFVSQCAIMPTKGTEIPLALAQPGPSLLIVHSKPNDLKAKSANRQPAIVIADGQQLIPIQPDNTLELVIDGGSGSDKISPPTPITADINKNPPNKPENPKGKEEHNNDNKINGKDNKVEGTKNQIIGDKNIVKEETNEVDGDVNGAIGDENKVKGNSNRIIGDKNKVEGNINKVVGCDNEAVGNSNVVVGKKLDSFGPYGTLHHFRRSNHVNKLLILKSSNN